MSIFREMRISDYDDQNRRGAGARPVLVPRVQVVTAAAADPVSMAELQEFLKIDNNSANATLAILLAAAVNEAEKYCHRAFINRTLRVWFDFTPLSGGSFELPYSPASSITSVKSYNDADTEATMTSTDYITDLVGEPPRIALHLGKTWPSDLRAINAVAIEYVAGYGAAATAVPSGIKQAILLLCAHYYEGMGAQQLENNFVPIDKTPAIVRAAFSPFVITHLDL